MHFERISEFIHAYKKRLHIEDDKRSAVCRVIKNISAVVVEEKDVSIKNGLVKIDLNPAAKNEIFLYKEKILNELKKEGYAGIHDIR